ncbi:class I SAM-dependent methyltransferase [Sphingomonas sp. MMS24-J45]|uniref:class I SAM-dependent methyltransferase n=1 Tax=Sphingomonas sp. MMS24-J45 TaxID=3238806 RepID=UPI00384D58B7
MFNPVAAEHHLPHPAPLPISTRLRQAVAGRSPLALATAGVKTTLAFLRQLTPAARAAARADQAFDRQWGTDTSRQIGMNALDFPVALKNGSFHYQASGAHVLDETIALARINPADYTFIDYGCGKGRVVLLAAAKPFARAIGVEYSAMLTQIAQANSATFLERGGAPITPEFWQGNAADYVPPLGALFCYLYNSFGAEILHGCLDRLEAAKAQNPARPILLAYVNPQCGDQVAARAAWHERAAANDIRLFECVVPFTP